ncbi:hypothetical protein [Paraburkholderia sp. D1E]|uniref:hypothetical protein n=1 Tax=Paraburkholderia sp. D1E TaxID=3461398 RepID=UPI00404643A1
MGNITADFGELLRQAPMTINGYLQYAHDAAEKYKIPEAQRAAFYGAYIQACAADYHTAAGSKCIEEALERIAYAISGAADDVSTALNNVAGNLASQNGGLAMEVGGVGWEITSAAGIVAEAIAMAMAGKHEELARISAARPVRRREGHGG